MEKQERGYWWHIGRRDVLQSVLSVHLSPKGDLKVLDVGCGTGINYAWLKEWGKITGLDPSPEALSYCRDKKVYDELIEAPGETIPGGKQYDLITAFDVLEHIKEDEKALRSWQAALKPGGFVFISIPAYQWLFSAHDVALHHMRRYSAEELRRKFIAAGLTPLFIPPFFFFTFPIVAAVRIFNRGSTPKTSYVETNGIADRVLIWLNHLEAQFLSNGGKLPWGSSLLVLARKR